MIYLPQNPCCSNPLVNTVPCPGGDPCTVQLVPTQYVGYSGPNLPCTGVQTCDTLTVALEKIDDKICSLQSQINILTNIVNNCCSTTTSTSTTVIPTTTTTTTIACLSCNFYSVTNNTIVPANVEYYACGGIYTTAIVGSFGTIYICACTGTVVVPPVPDVTLTNLGSCPTTTTTTSSSSTSTTTTTTTINPNCNNCSVPQFLPLPGNSVVVDGVTLDISSTKPGGLAETNQYLIPACLPDQVYHLVGGGGVLYTNWDYTITFSQPVNNVTLRIINYTSSTQNDSFGTPPFPHIISQERVVFTTNTDVPTVSICNACDVEVNGNYLQPILYWNPAGGLGIVNGSGSFIISQPVPFTTLTLTPQQMGYDPNVFSSGVFFDICGLEVAGGTTTTTTTI